MKRDVNKNKVNYFFQRFASIFYRHNRIFEHKMEIFYIFIGQ